MNYTDTLINIYDDAAFQTAFRQYFGELGCKVTNWDGLFAGMTESGENYAWVRKDEAGQVTGFIQFTRMEMKSWFFTAKCGFVREFWIAPDIRRMGHGSELLHKAEEWMRQQGCAYAILTTETAPDFYILHGYCMQKGIQARNEDDVFVKLLT